MSPFLLAAVVFASVAMLCWAVLSTVFSDERAVAKRLQDLTAYEADQVAIAHPQLQPISKRVIKPGTQQLKESVASMAPAGYRDRLSQRLVLAGSPRALDVGRVILLKCLLALSFGSLALVGAVVSDASGLMWMVALGATILAFFAPDLWISGRVEGRQKAIRRELPDMLDMLTISIEAGLGFDQAISKIVRLSHGPLAKEFARALQDIQAGSDRSEALKGLARRTEVPELNAFITSIVQAEQLGIPISQVLRTQASEMRLTRRQAAEEQAQKTPVKIVFPISLCIRPATLIVVIGPAVVSFGATFGAW